GGVSATNRPVESELAEQIVEIFTEVIVAPGFSTEAVDILTRKKNIRLLVVENPTGARTGVESRQISGGLLVQSRDAVDAPGDDPAHWTLVTGEPAEEELLAEREFAWRAVRPLKSDAFLIASDGATIGVGVGQVNRVDAARLAVARAGDRVRGSVAAGDAFCPCAHGLEILTEAGVRAVVQPGGSIRDEEVVAAAKSAGVTMYLTGTRHFFHGR